MHDPGAADEDAEDEAERRRRHQPLVATDRRVLTREKSNYAPAGERIEMIIRDGFFFPAAVDPFMATRRGPARDKACDEKFLELFPRAEAAVGYLHHSPLAHGHYAPAIFAAMKDNGGFSKFEFTRAMRRLMDAGRLRSVPHGPVSRGRDRLALLDPGVAPP